MSLSSIPLHTQINLEETFPVVHYIPEVKTCDTSFSIPRPLLRQEGNFEKETAM